MRGFATDGLPPGERSLCEIRKLTTFCAGSRREHDSDPSIGRSWPVGPNNSVSAARTGGIGESSLAMRWRGIERAERVRPIRGLRREIVARKLCTAGRSRGPSTGRRVRTRGSGRRVGRAGGRATRGHAQRRGRLEQGVLLRRLTVRFAGTIAALALVSRWPERSALVGAGACARPHRRHAGRSWRRQDRRRLRLQQVATRT
jgi:hypothetical protein